MFDQLGQHYGMNGLAGRPHFSADRASSWTVTSTTSKDQILRLTKSLTDESDIIRPQIPVRRTDSW
jgi:hypothetical protein